MTEVQFYHLTASPLERALPKLLEKAVSAGHRVLVLAESEGKVEQLNQLLWTYDPNSFLPHGSKKDPHPEMQPIYLTSEAESPNNPDVLVITDGSQLDVQDGVKKVVDMFDGGNEEALQKARARWKSYKASGLPVSYFQQNENGSWKKAA